MEYLVVGPTIINDIAFADGTIGKTHLGGSIFCVAGIKLWSDSCLFISNVGADFDAYYGKWMDENHCSRAGLNTILPHTQYTLLQYGDEGLHSEESIYGPEEDALACSLDHPYIEEIAKHCSADTKGIYVEAGESDPFWDQLDQIRAKGKIEIMWEIPTSAAMTPARHAQVLETIRKAGLYSINLPEAKSLFAASDEAGAIAAILAFGVPCYFRVGAKGSYMLCDGKAHFAPSITLGEVVDTTGCGNASTAAALYGWCERYTPCAVAAIGNLSAAYNLLQYGPWQKVTDDVRAAAHKLLQTAANE